MARNYNIRWTRSDYAKLSAAVRGFNRTIRANARNNELNLYNNYLPSIKNYQDIKSGIYTRKELNRVINQLNRIQRKGALNLVYLKSGDAVTQWELTETRRQQKLLQRDLLNELDNTPTGTGDTMGSERRREIIRKLEEINELEAVKGYDRAKLWAKVQKQGTLDYEFKKQIVFKENFLRTLRQDYSNEPFYKELIQKLNSMTPRQFYEFAYQNNLVDWLAADWYKLDQSKYVQLLRNADIADIPDYVYGEYQE